MSSERASLREALKELREGFLLPCTFCDSLRSVGYPPRGQLARKFCKRRLSTTHECRTRAVLRHCNWAVVMVGRSDSSQQSAAGWRSWPLVQSGDWGQVYVSSEGRFGYYDDDDGEDEAIVYFGAPLTGDGPYVYPRSALRQPPFDGKFVSLGQPSASEKFGLVASSRTCLELGILSPALANSPAAALAMYPAHGAMRHAPYPARGAMRPARGGTKQVSLAMLQEGKSIAQIAAARSLQASTIEGHIADLYTDGLCDDAPNLLGLTPAIRAEIRAINASLTGEDVGKLKPIKERCVHGYGLIRLALV